MVKAGKTELPAKFGRTLMALEKKGVIRIIEKKRHTTYITAFKEIVIHGQYRSASYGKPVHFYRYTVELTK